MIKLNNVVFNYQSMPMVFDLQIQAQEKIAIIGERKPSASISTGGSGSGSCPPTANGAANTAKCSASLSRSTSAEMNLVSKENE